MKIYKCTNGNYLISATQEELYIIREGIADTVDIATGDCTKEYELLHELKPFIKED